MQKNTQAITLDESRRLVSLEKIIDAGLDSFVQVGDALAEIRDSRLYRIEYGTFEEYCVEKWGFTRGYAKRLISSAEIAAEITAPERKPLEINKKSVPIGTFSPSSESQVRPLAALPPEQQKEAWQAAVAATPGKKPTAKTVQAAVDEIKPPPPRANPKPKPAAPDADSIHLRNELEATRDENVELRQMLDACTAKDPGKQIRLEVEKFNALNGRCRQLQNTAHETQKDVRYWQGVVNRIRLALGLAENADIVAAVKKLASHV